MRSKNISQIIKKFSICFLIRSNVLFLTALSIWILKLSIIYICGAKILYIALFNTENEKEISLFVIIFSLILFFKSDIFLEICIDLVQFSLLLFYTQVSNFYYVWNWSKSLLWRWVAGVGLWVGGEESNFSVPLWSKPRLRFLLRPRPKLNNISEYLL